MSGYVLPYLPKTNAVDRPAVEAKFTGYGSAGHTFGVGAYLSNEIVIENGSKVRAPLRAVSDMFPNPMTKNPVSMLHVLSMSAPFQVIGVVVQLIAVNMIYLISALWLWVVSQADHAMKRVGLFLVAKQSCGDTVAKLVYSAFNDTLWSAKSAKRTGFKAIGTGNT